MEYRNDKKISEFSAMLEEEEEENRRYLEERRHRQKEREREAKRRRRARAIRNRILFGCVCLLLLILLVFGLSGLITRFTGSGRDTAEDEDTGDAAEGGDVTPPVIDGVVALYAFIGEPVSYKSNLIVTDDSGGDVTLTVDTGAVDPETEGTYEITYTATDEAGNSTQVSTTVTFTEKPEEYIEESVVLAEAQEVLVEIVTDDMTLKQETRAIYEWVHENVRYSTTSDKESWTNGAHTGFTDRVGDCFIYFSTGKALLTAAGIPNIDVVRSDTTRARHYWSLVNCGDGWYHFDACIRADGGETFMYTDSEVAAYAASAEHTDYYTFDHSLYPSTPVTPFVMDGEDAETEESGTGAEETGSAGGTDSGEESGISGENADGEE